MSATFAPDPAAPRRGDERPGTAPEGEELVEVGEAEAAAVGSFDDMGLKDDLLRGVYAYGFERPSAIQQRAIRPLIAGRDVIGQAQSGTGKTGAFVIGALQLLDPGLAGCQVLALAPTRELARQIFDVFVALSEYLLPGAGGRGGSICDCIGGTSVRATAEAVRRAQIVVGCPGRVNDMLTRRSLPAASVRLVVVDEADEMLSRGFKDQLHDILRVLPPDVQIALFSATMPQEILDLAKSFMRRPVRILVKRDELTLEGIRQFYVDVEEERFKFDTLADLYGSISIASSVIFVNTRRRVDEVADKLRRGNFSVSCTHGDLSPKERMAILKDFRDGRSRVLLATDLMARGIDVQQVSLVINYDLPRMLENYLHRIGRSARFGRKGVAVNFVTKADAARLRDIERFYSTSIEALPSDLAGLLS
jgi:translation initiation factor 4A